MFAISVAKSIEEGGYITSDGMMEDISGFEKGEQEEIRKLTEQYRTAYQRMIGGIQEISDADYESITVNINELAHALEMQTEDLEGVSYTEVLGKTVKKIAELAAFDFMLRVPSIISSKEREPPP